jgi:hypothetical protein
MKYSIEEIIKNKTATGRNESQIKVYRELHNRFYLNPITIVETGCIRNDKNSCDGWGTLCWHQWARYTKSKVYSIDLSKESISASLNVIGNSKHVNYVLCDSIKYLQNLDENIKIDLLFLDSYDYDGDDENKKKAGLHQLEEIKAVEKNLHDKTFILIDDVFDTNEFSGKGKFSIPYLIEKKWKIINYINTQILLTK